MVKTNIISEMFNSWVTENGTRRLALSHKQFLPVSGKLTYSPSRDVFVDSVKKSYAKISGLRSMQNIKGAEREIIEMYRNELTHDIWGNEEKLKQWVEQKIESLAATEYPSELLSKEDVAVRQEGVKAWYDVIKSSYVLNNDLFTQLKIMKFVTDNLKINNKASVPPLNVKIFDDAAYEVKKKGVSFKKIYYDLSRKFDSMLNVKTEEVAESGVVGKWYSLRVPGEKEAHQNMGFFNKIKDYIAVLSQGSNWCLRTPKAVGRDFSNCDVHIFIDNNGKPQLCLTSIAGTSDILKFIRGNNQYAPIPNKFISVLKSFLQKHHLIDGKVSDVESIRAVAEAC